MVVYGKDSLDEISMSSPTLVCEINGKTFGIYEIRPEDFGYKTCDKSEMLGGTPEENAKIARDILEGKDHGPKRQAVCLNAGAALYIGGKASSMEEGVRLAEKLIDDGSAAKKLQEFIEETNR
jgi:anthranilate phosphoribosyltransferase